MISRNIRIVLLFSLLAFLSTSLSAQMPEPVKWTSSVEVIDNRQAVLTITATIEKGWHLYSQYIPDGGPIKTTFKFEPDASYEADGIVTEGKAIDFYDKNFEMQLKYFSHEAVFKQKIKIAEKKSFKIKGNVEFMVCDDEKCLPPNLAELLFEVKL